MKETPEEERQGLREWAETRVVKAEKSIERDLALGGSLMEYDIIQVVLPGAPCNYPVGRNVIDFRVGDPQAVEVAECYNQHCAIPDWVRYEIKART